MTHIWRAGVTAAFLSGIILTGCSPSAEAPLYDFIPADAVVIKNINLSQLLKDAESPDPIADGDSLTSMARALTDLCVEPDFREVFSNALRAREHADFSRLMSFTTSSGRSLIVFPLNAPEAFINTIDRGAGASMERGYIIVNSGDMTVAVKDNKCWIARSLDDIEEANHSAEANHIGTMPAIKQFVSSDAAANVAVNCGKSSLSYLGDADKWLCVSLKVSPQSVSARGVVMNRDGRVDSIGANFREIDTNFLRYTPSDAPVVLAFGKFSGNVRALSFLLGRFAPVYLSQASGTTSLYALPAGSAKAVAEHAPGSWNVETMVQVPQDVLREGLEEYMTGSGYPVTSIGDNQWTYSTGDDHYYFGAFDGALAFASNREISADYNNDFTEDFLGKRAAMVINIPDGSVLCNAWKLPCGLCFKVAVEATQWKARISFYGNRSSALATLLTLPMLPDYSARFNEATAL